MVDDLPPPPPTPDNRFERWRALAAEGGPEARLDYARSLYHWHRSKTLDPQAGIEARNYLEACRDQIRLLAGERLPTLSNPLPPEHEPDGLTVDPEDPTGRTARLTARGAPTPLTLTVDPGNTVRAYNELGRVEGLNGNRLGMLAQHQAAVREITREAVEADPDITWDTLTDAPPAHPHVHAVDGWKIPADGLVLVHGKAGSGKSWFLQRLLWKYTGRVLWGGFEPGFEARLAAWANTAPADQRPVLLAKRTPAGLVDALNRFNPRVVVLDGWAWIVEDENSAAAVDAALDRITGPGRAVLVAHHEPWSTPDQKLDRPRGSSRLHDLAHLSVRVAPTADGLIRAKLSAKNRHGLQPPGYTVDYEIVDGMPRPHGLPTTAGQTGGDNPGDKADQVLAWLLDNPGAHTTNAVREAVGGKWTAVKTALEDCTRAGLAERNEHGNTVRWEAR